MKPYFHVLLATGHRYEIPTAVVAENRAKAMLELHPDEFPDLAASMADSEELFEDNGQVRDWALNNMNVPELMKHARLVRYEPPEADFDGGDWSYHDAPALIPQLDAASVLGMPMEMAVSAMAVHRNLCQMVTLNNDDGTPGALVVLVQGPPALVGTYIGALQHLTTALLQPAQPQAASDPEQRDTVLQLEQPGKMQ